MSHYEKVAEAIHYLKNNVEEQPSLLEVADQSHLSPFHFQRVFSEWVGVSPKKFLQFLSLNRAKSLLAKGESLLSTTYKAGLSGTGRLHDLFVQIEAMTPGQYKSGGAGLDINYQFGECQFGSYLVAATSLGICNLLFFDGDEQEVMQEMQKLWPGARLTEGLSPHFSAINNYFKKEDATQLKLHLKGTPFQLKVWEALLKIPEGGLVSYGHISEYIQQPTAQRAVGTAIGSNPIAHIIPCHRVIRSTGVISDYRWGTDRKMAMIGWEASQLP